ncbi:hypothetical protein CR513_00171, partial [Mucuna pruriens]
MVRQYANQADKGYKKVSFELGDWVCIHMRKERSLARRQSKLQPRDDSDEFDSTMNLFEKGRIDGNLDKSNNLQDFCKE